MRTKNLNLKKKIAFIASVAMIATTAAYLPAEVFAKTAQTTVNQRYKTEADEAYTPITSLSADSEHNAGRADDGNVVTTFDAFVKIDGKYLAKAVSGTTSPAYKLFNSKDAVSSEYALVSALNNVEFLDVDDDAPFYNKTTGANATYNDTKGNYNILTPKVASVIQIPYFETANPEVTLEFAAKKGAVLGSRSATSVSVTLDDNGMAKIPTQSEFVVGISDDSTYNESTRSFGEFEDTTGPAVTAEQHAIDAAKGSYDELDLSGVVIQMASQDVAEVESLTKDAGGDLTAAVGAQVFSIEGANEKFGTEKTYPNSFMIKKVGSVYANVLTLAAPLTTAADPNGLVTIKPNFFNTWTVRGNGYSQSKNELNLTMGEDGWAESDLITATKDGKKEYFVFVVQNKQAGIVTSNDAEKEITIKGFAGVDGTGLRTDDGAKKADLDSSDNASNLAKNRFRVEHKLTSERLKNNNTVYVNEYTIYNNESDSEYTKTSDGNRGDDVIIVNGTGNFDLANGTDNTAAKKILGNANEAPAGEVKQDVNTYLVKANTGAWESDAAAGDILLQKTAAGIAESGIIKYTDNAAGDITYIKLIFKDEYKIKYDDADSTTNTGLDYDGKVDVDGTKITKPADGAKSGYEFLGWTNDAGKDVFSTDSKEQLTEEAADITPNTTLTAKYTGYRYNVIASITDGYLDPGTSGAAPSSYIKYNGASKPTVATLSNTKKGE